VMIDGRTVYSPLFSGVFWEAQDILIEDIARIEVISGPGGTFWGTNAVHGVIHIITRSADETQGVMASGAMGPDLSRGAARVGGTIGEAGAFRVYGQYADQDHTELGDGTEVRDRSNRAQGGFRADWRRAVQTLALSGDLYRSDLRQTPGTRVISGSNVVASWMRSQGDGRDFRVQAFLDHTERDQPASIRDRLNTWDLELQRAFRPAEPFDVLIGAGYRYYDDRLRNPEPPTLAFIPANRIRRVTSGFAQGDVRLREDLELSLGLKLEHNDYTGEEWLPNVRLGWKRAEGSLLWGEAARAIRTPSRLDREFYVPGVPPYFIAGGPDFDSEVASVLEVGWRSQPSTRLSYAITGFFHDLDHLRSLRATPAGLVFANDIAGTLSGVEAWGSYRFRPWWRIAASVVEQRLRLHTEPGTSDYSNLTALGNDPNVFFKVRQSFDLGGSVDLDVIVRHYGALPHPVVPEYTEADVRLGWWMRPELELSLSGTNLVEPRHPEWGVAANRAEIERSFLFKLVWRR